MRVHKNKKCKILMTKKKINNMNLFFHTLVMLVVGCSVNAGGSRDLYVDGIAGSDNKACTETQPCKRIEIAVQVLRSDEQTDEGTIHLYGNHSMNQSIQIEKALTIRGYRNAAISSSNKSEPVFWTNKQLSLLSLSFERITPIKLFSSTEHKVIVIHNCQFNRTMIDLQKNINYSVNLFISKSNFTESTVKVVGTKYWGLTLSGCTFTYTKTNNHVMHVEDIGRFDMNGTMFSNITTFGACLNVMNSKNVSISNSKFLFNSAAESYVLYVLGSAITIVNTEFALNHAYKGGGFYMKKCNVKISNTKINSNSAVLGGGGFFMYKCNATIFKTQVSSNTCSDGGGFEMSKCTATIVQTKISSNTAKDEGSGGGFYLNKSNVTIVHTEIISNNGCHGGGFYLYKSNSTIVNSRVLSNTAGFYDGGGIYTFKSTAKVVNSQLISNTAFRGGGFYIWDSSTTLVNTKVISNTANKFGGGYLLECKASILSTEFFNNSADLSGGALAMSFMTSRTVMTNLSFVRNIANEGGALHMESSDYQINLTDCHFVDNSAHKSGGAVFASRCMGDGIIISKSFFRKCFADVGGALVVEHSNIKVENSELRENWAKTTTSGLYVAWRNGVKNRVLIQSSSFVDNNAPSLSISSYKISITKSTFTATTDSPINHMNLNGYEILVQSIYVKLVYTKLPQSNTELGFMALTSKSGKMNVTGLNISCSRFFHVKVSQRKVVPTLHKTESNLLLKLKCATCGPDEFTLENTLLAENYEQELDKKVCKPCPAGAICNGYIRVLDGFWGYKAANNELVIWPCPRGYCCTSQTVRCETYNTCGSGRTGKLCGRCKDGYFQSFLTDDCISKGSASKRKCNFSVFLMFFVGVAWAYTLIFTFLPPLAEQLKKIKSPTKAQDEITEKGSRSNEIDILESMFKSRYDAVVDERPPTPIGGVITLVIFFFQLASLVSIDVLSRNNTTGDADTNQFTKAFLDAFNFRFSVYRELCPTDDLTLVLKLFLNLGIKISTVLNVLLMFIVYKAIVLIKGIREDNSMSHRVDKSAEELQDLDSVPSSSSSDEVEQILRNKRLPDSSISIASHLKIGLLKLLKANYTSSMVILLQLIHCETLRDKPRLYLYADHICYIWWQWLIIVLIIPTLVMFPMSFGMALNRLKARTISTTTFLTSCVIPFAFCVRTKIVPRNTGFILNEEEEKCAKVILEQEEELFDEESKGIRWPVLQLYRMMVIVLVNTFVLNTIFKSLWFFGLFLAFTIHDRDRMPYKSQFLNQLQCLTSACLFLVNLCSNPSAFSSVANITSVPNMDICLTILGYFKLLLYAIVLLSFPMWKIWEQIVERVQRRRKTN